MVQHEQQTTLDPEDYENEATSDEAGGLLGNDYDRVIQVKVPKVPYNFEAIQRQQSKAHLPINLPEEHTEDILATAEKFSTSTKKPSVSLQILANFTQYCPPARSRNLFWNWTLAVSKLCFYNQR